MKSLLLLIIIGILFVIVATSCERTHTEYKYRVKFITSGAKSVVKDIELGTQTFGSYSKGDTVHIKGDMIVKDGRYRKAVILLEIQ